MPLQLDVNLLPPGFCMAQCGTGSYQPFFFHSVSEDYYETKIIRARANKRRKRILYLDLFEPFCEFYNGEMTDTFIPGITVPTLRNMNPFQPPFGRGFPEQHKGLLAA